ncbi:hydrolase [Rhizobium leguminosarum]|uniref:hydrolase n=1 Tax=Rhizobium leguminosarum TaxID=384 RepID=UPI001FE02D4B|nr:hydrolase [Rhizobium leguminosarum]
MGTLLRSHGLYPDMNAYLELDWWPVGQGLFSSGLLTYDHGVVRWVYDCGTTSSNRYLESALLDYGQEKADSGSSAIDFAVLSHFDRDHVSGFERLVSRHPIRMVLLPYIPLWQRLVIAAEEGIAADEPLFRFFVNPAGYLLAVPGSEIRQVIYVPAGGDDESGGDDGGLPFTPAPEDGSSGDLKINYGEPPEDVSMSVVAKSFDDPRVRYLASRGRLVLPFWEFVPYNDADLQFRVGASFLAAAAPLVERLRNPKRGSPAAALKKLKALYDRTFGKSSARRNQISLFLYSGPLGQTFLADAYPHHTGLHRRFAQLSPGDGLLDTPDRLTRMIDFYGSDTRIAKLGILQVMHHGAASSWHDGVAERLCPVSSIFCSEPTDKRYRHPHADVLRDFWSYGAVQVDSVERFQTSLWLDIRSQ